MGQKLTHGVYLPDEGERNCYSGLAANWSILDNSVGTIAEHTSALAGKAPAVHTHTKADITDFPVYGTTAGTICEGNDSRLSDARTPVAHTHTKSDVTDLFNSANTWTGDNSFSRNITLLNQSWSGATPPSSAQTRQIEFKNADTRQGRYINRTSPSSTQTWIETIRNVDANTSHNFTLILSVNDNGEQSMWPYLGDMNLGSLARRIKTINEVNPGALSIPNKDNKVDITSEFTDLTGGNNFYIPPADGFVSINADTEIYCAVVSSTHNTAFWRQSAVATTTGYASVTIPVRAGLHLLAKIKSTGAIYAEFYPCLGNV